MWLRYVNVEVSIIF